MKTSKGVLRRAVPVAGAALALGVLGSTQAYAADDWKDWSEWQDDAPEGLPSQRYDTLEYQGGWVSFSIHWDGTREVWLDIGADDTKPEGYAMVGQVRYQVYRNGQWSGWQYRNAVTATGASSPAKWKIYENKAPVRYVHVRGCYANASGIVNCDNSWH